MSEKLNIAVLAGAKEGTSAKGFTVPLFVIATNDQGQRATGYQKGNFDVELLAPTLDHEESRLFQLELSSVKELGNGLYKVVCKNSLGTGFLSGRIVLLLNIKRDAAKGVESGTGQALFALSL